MPEEMITGLGLTVCGFVVVGLGITTVTIVATYFLIKYVSRAFGPFGPDQKVLEEGVAGEATILKVRQTGVMVNDQPQVALTLDVRISDWEPYQAETKMVIPIVNVPQFQPGAVVPVKVDPSNRSKVALDVALDIYI
jgi:hypothetical protein